MIKSRVSLIIFKIKFFFYIINYTFLKNRINKKKNLEFLEFKNFVKNKKFSSNWFINNYKIFDYFSSNFLPQKFKYLEIGSFEGMSALYILNKFKNVEVTCIDQWEINEKDSQKLDFNFINVEKNFDENLKNFSVKKIKKSSSQALDDLKKEKSSFDCIYIDGSHDGADILKDARQSFDILKNDGIIIFDDVVGLYEFIEIQPHNAFEIFYREFKQNIKILYLKNIAIIKKTT